MMRSGCFSRCQHRILSHVARSVRDANVASDNTRVRSVALGHAKLTRRICTTQKLPKNSFIVAPNIQRWFQLRSLSVVDSSMPLPSSTSVYEPPDDNRRGRRVWKAAQYEGNFSSCVQDGSTKTNVQSTFWDKAIDDVDDRRTVHDSLARICEQVRRNRCVMRNVSYTPNIFTAQIPVSRNDKEAECRRVS